MPLTLLSIKDRYLAICPFHLIADFGQFREGFLVSANPKIGSAIAAYKDLIDNFTNNCLLYNTNVPLTFLADVYLIGRI